MPERALGRRPRGAIPEENEVQKKTETRYGLRQGEHSSSNVADLDTSAWQ